jgi:WD40 repeat protein/outer membrane protein OmpA-like peptidoglycan-associated protein
LHVLFFLKSYQTLLTDFSDMYFLSFFVISFCFSNFYRMIAFLCCAYGMLVTAVSALFSRIFSLFGAPFTSRFFYCIPAICINFASAATPPEARAQSITVFDLNASSFPQMRAKFFALDAAGAPVRDISARDILIRENGVARRVVSALCPPETDVKSLSVTLTIDVSGSMGWSNRGGATNLSLAQAAARAWVNAMPENDVECAVTSYDHRNYLNQDFTQDRKRLLQAVQSLKPMGGTDYDMGLLKPIAGALYVMRNARFQRRIIIFLTDGLGAGTEKDIVAAAKDEGVTIYCVTLGMPAPDILRNIAQATGGEVFENITTIQEAEQIYRILLRLALGNKPCEVAWISEQTCNTATMRSSFTLPARGTTQNFSYDVPIKSLTGLELSSEALSFGGVPPGTTREMKLVVRARNSSFTIDNIVSSDERFSVSPKYFQLRAGQRKALTIKFTPSDSGYVYAKLTFMENLCGGRVMHLSGGFLGKSPSASTLTLIEPNGGEEYAAGSDTTIQWSGITPSEAISVDFSPDKGRTWLSVLRATSGLRADWRLPRAPTSDALIKIRQLQKPNISTFQDYISSAAFLGKNNSVVTLGSGGAARAWDVASGAMGQIYFSNQLGQTQKEALPGMLVVSPDERFIVAGFLEGTARIWEAQSGEMIDAYYDHLQAITALKFSPVPGSRLVLSASLDSSVKLWNVETTETARSFQHKGAVYDASFSPNGATIASGGAEGVVKIWDAKTGELLQEFEGHNNAIFSVSFSPDGAKLLTAGADGAARLWDINKSKLHKSLIGHKNIITSAVFSPDGSRVVTASADSSLRVWDAQSGKLIHTLRGHAGAVRKVVFTPDGSAIASVSSDRTARLWDIETGKTVQILNGAAALDSAQQPSWSAARGGGFSPTPPTQGVSPHTGAIFDIVFSPDSRLAATIGSDRSVLFWRVNTTASVSTPSRPLRWKPDTSAVQEVISRAPFAITKPNVLASDIDMGRRLRGDVKDSLLFSYLNNKSKFPIRIDKVFFVGDHAEDFSVVSGGAPCIIAPRSSRDVEIRFRPSGTGERKARLIVVSQADTTSYNVVGWSVAPLLIVTNPIVDFEEVKIKQRKDTLVAVIKNISLQPVVITGLTFAGPNTTDFRLAGNLSADVQTDTTYILYPQATMSLRLRYQPTSAGGASCQLQIAYNSLGSPAIVQLFGTGGSTIFSYIHPYGVKPNPNPSRNDSVEYPLRALRIEEFISKTLHPLLGYVFFDYQSFTLPARYPKLTPEQAAPYKTDKLSWEKTLTSENSLGVYRNILNIIGSRLARNPSASLTLVGCKSSKERFAFAAAPDKALARPALPPLRSDSLESATTTNANFSFESPADAVLRQITASGDERLPEARALAVREYLCHTWGIEKERVQIMFRNTPEQASNDQTPDGIAENSRVEIIASSPDILDAVVVADTLRAMIPPVVRFRVNASSQVNLTKWSVQISQSSGPKNKRVTQRLASFSGAGKPRDRVDWNVARDNAAAPKTPTPLQYQLYVDDESGARAQTGGFLPVEIISIAQKRQTKTADKEINTFGLLLFGFNKASLGAHNDKILDYVRSQIRPESRIVITGYTDRTGSAPANKKLSLLRAEAAAAALAKPEKTAVEGVGSAILLHDNATPEGRFYCRTVNIVVEHALGGSNP